MECEFPMINSNMDEVKEIFDNVKTIAVLGLSPDESKIVIGWLNIFSLRAIK